MAIELATPISQLFDDPEIAARIASASACLECREQSLGSALPRQYLFHSEANIIHPWDESRKRQLADAFELKRELRLVSFHAACNCDRPSVDSGMFRPGGRRLTREEMLQAAVDNTAWLRGALPPGALIAVENNNYFPTQAYQTVTDGDFLTELTERTGCRLLLDVAHAMITAHNTDRRFEEYISTLPLARTVQLHICEPELRPGPMAADAHRCPGQDMDVQAVALARALPVQYVSVEYYKDAELLIDSLLRYKGLLS
ncbi:MAG: DUF692 family protein [Bryobacterales bacterium]|nr:DUF692 family protein [Bryobacterales bacterium]